MFGITLPRLLSASLLIAYMREMTMYFIAAYVISSVLILCHPYVTRGSAKDDPGNAFLGLMTNLFSPCIIIEEGSKFLVKSSIIATLSHCLTQALILLFIVSKTMTIDANENPPILHCFNITRNSTFSRCLVKEEEPSNCTNGMFHSEGDKNMLHFAMTLNGGCHWWSFAPHL